MIRVDTLTELFDVGPLLAYQPLPTGRRVAAVTNSTALAALVADAVPRRRAGDRSAAPVDLGPDVDVAGFAAALRTAGEQRRRGGGGLRAGAGHAGGGLRPRAGRGGGGRRRCRW